MKNCAYLLATLEEYVRSTIFHQKYIFSWLMETSGSYQFILLSVMLTHWWSYSVLFSCMYCQETIQKGRNKYSQKGNCKATIPISTFPCLWTIYIFQRSIYLFWCRKICGPILGIYQSLTDTWMWNLGLRPRNSQKRNPYINGIFPLQCGLDNFCCRSHPTTFYCFNFKCVGRGRPWWGQCWTPTPGSGAARRRGWYPEFFR